MQVQELTTTRGDCDGDVLGHPLCQNHQREDGTLTNGDYDAGYDVPELQLEL